MCNCPQLPLRPTDLCHMALHQSTDGHASQGKFLAKKTCPCSSCLSLSAGDKLQMKAWRYFVSSWIIRRQVKQSCSLLKATLVGACARAHTRFLLSLSDLIRVTGALPIGCESGPLLPRAANFPYSRADRKLWLSTELRRDKESFPLAIHISLHQISSYNTAPCPRPHPPANAHFIFFLLSSFPPSFLPPEFWKPNLHGLHIVSPLNWYWLLWWAGSFTSCGDICILWHNPALRTWFTLSAYHYPLIAVCY